MGFLFWDSVSHGPGWSWTWYIADVDLEFLILRSPLPGVLRLHSSSTTPRIKFSCSFLLPCLLHPLSPTKRQQLNGKGPSRREGYVIKQALRVSNSSCCRSCSCPPPLIAAFRKLVWFVRRPGSLLVRQCGRANKTDSVGAGAKTTLSCHKMTEWILVYAFWFSSVFTIRTNEWFNNLD